ncbi:hypothetical protein KCP76_21410 [Salmonella enterica subsp. enterica serovar Weltevreden]|nr:hypothetical protein KCP76_21410 [Salmonella enterica subsp. enterica serovar Weltevreden]
MMEIMNIDLLATMLLEPQQPYHQRQPDGRQTAPVIWSGRGRYSSELKDEERYQPSRHFLFTISVSGPSAGVLAFKHLPTQSYRWPYC